MLKALGAVECHIRRKPNTEQIDVVQDTASVLQPHDITVPRTSGYQRFTSVVGAAGAEVSQKRISCAEREKSQSWWLSALRLRKQAVDDLVGSTVAADGEESSISGRIRLARQDDTFSRGMGKVRFESNTRRAQILHGRAGKLSRAPSARRRIDDCEPILFHSGVRAESRLVRLRICWASSPRLIFSDAVRGKSRSHKREALTRLKSGRRRLRPTRSRRKSSVHCCAASRRTTMTSFSSVSFASFGHR